MKEIYDWVPWFQELAQKIADRGKSDLTKRANKVAWGGNTHLSQNADEGIDPFSFFYLLASKAATSQLKTVYESVSREFGIERRLPDTDVDDNYIFPTPQARFSAFYERSDQGHELLWRLFSDAVQDQPTIDPTDFEDALKLKGVGVTRLTQTLFLINPNYFQPVDNITDDLSSALRLPAPTAIESGIKKDGGYEKYQTLLGKINQAFPGCQPYEVNMFLYLVRPNATNRIDVSGGFYQISTYVYFDSGDDYWENVDDSFKENNWVFTGAPGSGLSWEEPGNYPLTEPRRGDVILVRTGRQRGRAIGIVLKNDYRESGIRDSSRIHVLWINRSEGHFSRFTAMQGFSRAGSATFQAFVETGNYKPSFDLIERLSENLSEEDSETDLEDEQQLTLTSKNPHPLNQILFGPPGTSKTWNTVDYALSIMEDEPLDVVVKKSREDKLCRFNELKKNGQIEMVTFHQNYNYEDFIEGIRPVLAGDAEGSVEYELSEGVFRQISERAEENTRRFGQTDGESWDIVELLQAFAKSIDEKLVSDEPVDLFPPGRKRVTRIVKVNWSRDGIFKSVNAGTEKSWRYLTRDVIKEYYRAFYSGKIESEKAIRPTRESKRTQHSHAHYYYALFERIREFHDEEWQQDEHGDIEQGNYVLIIDEINRGNIAKIFGELITVIEDSKRTGGPDATTVTLPYSKKDFGVPDNLYIIGTMNTADRSIALLDTALRRRFDFVEMMPDLNLVSEDVDGINCRELLETMNERIRFLLDREHQIGHTYLMNVKSIDSLASTFKNRIVPLLQEYFYDNWEKIDLVLNRNGFIRKITIESGLFKESDLIDDQSESYELLPAGDDKWHNHESYLAIYEQAKSGSEQGS